MNIPVPNFDLMHIVLVILGVVATLAYQKYAAKKVSSPSAPGIPSTTGANSPDILIPGRPVLTMILSLLHKAIDGSTIANTPSNSPLDLQAELMLLLHKLQIQSQPSPLPPTTPSVVQPTKQ